MKNIHILPTDKSSKVKIRDNGNFILGLPQTNYHIYITSDEEIKEGDWVLFTINDVTEIIKVTTVINNAFDSKEGFGYGLENCKKIIITTDQELIVGGVQDIDDEFLEWFVKNPSCERVEVVDDTLTVGEMSKLPLGTKNHKYKIIIPKEEPKQETVEEAAEYAWSDYEYEEGNLYSTTFKNAFKLGAKWMQERMYSEEDRFEIELNKLINRFVSNGLTKSELVSKMKYITKSCEIS